MHSLKQIEGWLRENGGGSLIMTLLTGFNAA